LKTCSTFFKAYFSFSLVTNGKDMMNIHTRKLKLKKQFRIIKLLFVVK
jgi:hypothetical protein